MDSIRSSFQQQWRDTQDPNGSPPAGLVQPPISQLPPSISQQPDWILGITNVNNVSCGDLFGMGCFILSYRRTI